MGGQLFVESWAPEYGASVEPDEALSAAEGSVDIEVEDRPWGPVDGHDDGMPVVAFVDGVRRVDARLVLDDPDSGPVPGICGSFAAGAIMWDRFAPVSTIRDVVVDRIGLLVGGRSPELPPMGAGLTYRPMAVSDDDPSALIRGFHDAMRRAEARIVEDLALGGYFVIADGPLYDYTDTTKVGFIKSHRRSYLPDDAGGIIGTLGAGQRTPLFSIGQGRFRRYSWYVRLGDLQGHSWSGIARCEASAVLDVDTVVTVADRCAAVLPLTASESYRDPRAPQNLVPIAALERDLRHRLGDAGLVLRALKESISGVAA